MLTELVSQNAEIARRVMTAVAPQLAECRVGLVADWWRRPSTRPTMGMIASDRRRRPSTRPTMGMIASDRRRRAS